MRSHPTHKRPRALEGTLPGPSKTIIVEPLQIPKAPSLPRREPIPLPKPPNKEPREPAPATR